ncbi:MAG: hypothetical protein HQL66_02085 [Magnetococcales bacterium]|nr:hypothetical protein [Magnetococcales bacterium]
MEPEKALWMAVLEQAVKDARALIRRAKADPTLWDSPSFRGEVKSLRRWFLAKSQHPGGFGFVCDLAGLDPERALARIDEKYLRHLTPEIG